jgi:hypothetical protein
MKDILTEGQILKIEAFCADKEMYDAVKKVLLQHLYTQGVIVKGEPHNPLFNRAFSLVQLATQNPIPDEQLGAHLRGIWEGVNALEGGYAELDKIKSAKKESIETPYNEAE